MNHKYHVFVTEYLKWGDQVLAYKNAYKSDSSYKSLQSAANRLLKHPEVAKAIYEAEARIRSEVEIAIANRQIREVLTIEEKRSLLKQIAAGTMYVEQKYKGKNCTQCSQYISPTIKEMLWAIREDSKLAGHYPYKLNGKWIIPAFPEEEVKDENPIQNTCPNDEIGRATGAGGEPTQDENTNTENLQHFTTIVDQEISPLQGDLGVDSRNLNTPENDNKIQHPEEDIIDNQPITKDPETHNTPTVNPSGRIITRAELKELLHPSPKPKLMPMTNEQHE